MNAVERHYRLLTLQERIAQLEGELVVIVEETQRSPLQDRLAGAIWNLQQAARKLEWAAPPTSATQTNLERILEVSIEGVRERKLCEVIGGGVPSEIEKPRCGNIEAFPKPSTVNSQGE